MWEAVGVRGGRPCESKVGGHVSPKWEAVRGQSGRPRWEAVGRPKWEAMGVRGGRPHESEVGGRSGRPWEAEVGIRCANKKSRIYGTSDSFAKINLICQICQRVRSVRESDLSESPICEADL